MILDKEAIQIGSRCFQISATIHHEWESIGNSGEKHIIVTLDFENISLTYQDGSTSYFTRSLVNLLYQHDENQKAVVLDSQNPERHSRSRMINYIHNYILDNQERLLHGTAC